MTGDAAKRAIDKAEERERTAAVRMLARWLPLRRAQLALAGDAASINATDRELIAALTVPAETVPA